MYYPDGEFIGKTHMIPNIGVIRVLLLKGKEKLNSDQYYLFPKNVESWIDYRSIPKIGVSANIDPPCNMFKITIKETPIRSLNITKTVAIPF